MLSKPHGDECSLLCYGVVLTVEAVFVSAATAAAAPGVATSVQRRGSRMKEV